MKRSTRPSSLLQASFLVSVATLACFAPAHSAQDPGAPAAVAAPIEPGVPDAVRQALLAHEWERALEALARAEAAEPQFADWWTYLRGSVLARARRNDAALEAFAAVEQRTPPSVWRHKARFARADLLRELGRAAEAEAIYEAEARRLLSTGRQEELARIYTAAADELSTPPATPTPEAPKLDWGRAATLYRKALELDVGASTREHALYRVIVCLQSSANPSQAVQVTNEYRNAFDPTRAKTNPVGARLFEVLYRRAECQRSLGMLEPARRDLEDLIAALDGARAQREPWGAWIETRDEAQRAELARLDGDAHRLIADTYADDASSVRLAVAALERFLAKFPAHPKALESAQSIGLRFARAGLDEEALEAFDAFLERAEPTDAAAREEFAKLYANALFNKGEVLARQQRFEPAIAAYSQYVARFSTGAEWSRAQAGIVAAEFARGDALSDARKFAEARSVWTSCIERYPLDSRTAPTTFAIGASFAAEARALPAPVDAAQRERLFRDALAQWRRVVSKYPGSEAASQALYASGALEEQELGELEAAVKDYQTCNFGAHAAEAARALARMTEPALAVRSEEAWRTAGAPRVKVEVRNLEKLSVDLFALDLEAYFRKQLTHLSVEDLDLDLISPDRSFERAVDDYAKYAPRTLDLELPVKGPGVWVVAVSAGELRATTLVISSDLDVIVRSGAKEMLVFAQDMAAGKPAPGVRVLVAGPNADGVPTVREASTGADGTVRLDLEGLTAGASVLALREGHCAAAGAASRTPSTSTPRMPRGVVYTDRPAYRPGELVHWRAILREVQDGRYGFQAGKAYDVTVSDSQGRVVSKRKLALSEFGTLTGDVVLDELATVGDWRVACSTPNGPSFFGSFTVQQFQLPKVQLELSTPREIYFRGERVEVTARATYYWGEPVANAKLAALLPDGRVLELATDAQGKAEFGFETRDFAVETGLTFSATLSEEGLTEQDGVFLAVREFHAYVSTARDLMLAGSSFDVTVGTPGVDGKPVGRPMKLVALRREVVDGRTTETQVGEWSLTTDAEKGEAHQPVALARGGSYVLRASGVDRFGNPIVGERIVEISGEEDAQRLRWIVDTHRFDVGSKATLTLVDREADGLALLTLESDTFLEHRVLALRKGTNAVELAIDHAHHPGFTAAIAMMRPGALFTDEVQLSVRRELRVVVEPETPDAQPGAEASFRITTVDQLGRPVPAELSLAVVDEAIYGLWSDTLPDVRALFDAAEERRGNFATVSSATFRYRGATRAIARAVLDEARRAQEELAWAADQVELLKGLGYDGSDAFVGGVQTRAREKLRFEPAQEAEAGTALGVGVALGKASGGPASPGPRGGGGGGRGRAGGATVSKAGYKGAGDTAPGAAPVLETFDTAHWSASVVTDANGKATVKARMPERSTRWRVVALGADKTLLFGQTRTSIVTKQEFFVELRAPLWLVEGDAPRCSARLHNLTGLTGTARLVLRATRGGQVEVHPLDVALDASGEVEVVFPPLAAVGAGGELALELEATGELDGQAAAGTRAAAGARPYRPVAKAAARASVRPWGLELAATRSGTLQGSARIELELDPARKATGRTLEIALGPNVDALLVNAALGLDGLFYRGVGEGHATTAADLIGACETLALVESSGRAENPEHARLIQRAQGLAARLIAAQRPDGSWSWVGSEREPHVETTCLAMIALTRARARGVPVFDAALANGRGALQKGFREAAQQADELKALLSWALAENEQGDFGALNRLHRERATLSPAALAYTALALAAMSRGPMAAEVAEVLETKALDTEVRPQRCAFDVAGNVAWSRSRLAMTALAALALQRAKPSSTRLPAAIAELLATRPWYDGRARGLAVAAIALWRGKTQPSNERMRVTVSLEGLEPVSVDFTAARPGETLRFELPDSLPSKLVLAFELEGRGEPHYSAVLRGFTSDVSPRRTDVLEVREHRYQAAAPRHRGRELPAGFDVLDGPHEQWQNQVTELGYGGMLRATLDYDADGDWKSLRESAHYLVLEVPVPGGARLLEGSLTSDVLHHEERDGLLVLHLGQRVNWSRIGYTLVGVVPGKYRVGPPVLRSLYEPEEFSIGKPLDLTVLARGEASKDSYRATPDELYHRGEALYLEGDLEGARVLLQQLFDQWEPTLRQDVLSKAAGWLLFANIERKSSRDIVRYFEILKEKDPDLYVPFEKVMAVGAAYREIEEHERALTIFRATIDETFGKELRVVGTLEEQDEPYEAIQTMRRLCREYPDAASVVVATLSLSDKLLVLAPRAARIPALVAKDIDRARLTAQGVRELQRFLATYVLDPLAPEAGLNLVTAHLSIDDYAAASKLGGEFAAAFGEPRFSDAFAYSRAVADWYLERDDEALKALERIAAAEYTAPDGTKSPSPNRDLALYILGQIHHARQEFGKAAGYYDRVQQLFADAREALEGFRERKLALQELTSVRPGERVELEVSHRNVKQAELLVYPVDLMTLYLRERNLSRVTQVNLSGIAPKLQRQVELRSDDPLRPAKTKVTLDLEEPGAYLVICRGGDLHASGLVLLTQIELEVEEDSASGHVRIQVSDQKTRDFVRGVDVRVIGTQNAEFLSGKTDPRGLFVTDGVDGSATVIARTDARHYAFHRGTVVHALAQAGKRIVPQTSTGADDYFQNVNELNRASQQQRAEGFGEELRKSRQGVQIKTVR